jgi:hypothetical protein
MDSAFKSVIVTGLFSKRPLASNDELLKISRQNTYATGDHQRIENDAGFDGFVACYLG